MPPAGSAHFGVLPPPYSANDHGNRQAAQPGMGIQPALGGKRFGGNQAELWRDSVTRGLSPLGLRKSRVG
jgi:hypothetical protein